MILFKNIEPDKLFNIIPRVDSCVLEFAIQVVDLIRVGGLEDFGSPVVRQEGIQDGIRIVNKVEDERSVLTLSGKRAVQSRQSLHGFNSIEALINVHRAQ